MSLDTVRKSQQIIRFAVMYSLPKHNNSIDICVRALCTACLRRPIIL